MICSSYGIDSNSVREYLRVGFTKDDVYSVCERVSSAICKGSPMIVEEVESYNTKTSDTHSNKSEVRDLFSVNRRGI